MAGDFDVVDLHALERDLHLLVLEVDAHFVGGIELVVHLAEHVRLPLFSRADVVALRQQLFDVVFSTSSEAASSPTSTSRAHSVAAIVYGHSTTSLPSSRATNSWTNYVTYTTPLLCKSISALLTSRRLK